MMPAIEVGSKFKTAAGHDIKVTKIVIGRLNNSLRDVRVTYDYKTTDGRKGVTADEWATFKKMAEEEAK